MPVAALVRDVLSVGGIYMKEGGTIGNEEQVRCEHSGRWAATDVDDGKAVGIAQMVVVQIARRK
jgi:hypothetical protein